MQVTSVPKFQLKNLDSLPKMSLNTRKIHIDVFQPINLISAQDFKNKSNSMLNQNLWICFLKIYKKASNVLKNQWDRQFVLFKGREYVTEKDVVNAEKIMNQSSEQGDCSTTPSDHHLLVN
jgi:hypothetical protein